MRGQSRSAGAGEGRRLPAPPRLDPNPRAVPYAVAMEGGGFGFPLGGDPEDLLRGLREFAEQQAETVQEAQREQFATLTLNTAVELTGAALSQLQPAGTLGRAGGRACAMRCGCSSPRRWRSSRRAPGLHARALGSRRMLRRLSDWRIDRMTDRVARRPSGRRARKTYGADDVHSFAWEPVLGALQLTSEDLLLGPWRSSTARSFACCRPCRGRSCRSSPSATSPGPS